MLLKKEVECGFVNHEIIKVTRNKIERRKKLKMFEE